MRHANPTSRPHAQHRSLNIRAHAHTILTLSIGIGCLLVGGAFLWAWFDPERLAETSPIHLLGLLGLFLLPAATISFQTIDRRRRTDTPSQSAAQKQSLDVPEPQSAVQTHAIRRHRAARRSAPGLRTRRSRPIS